MWLQGLSMNHLIVLAAVTILLFGRGRVKDLLGDVGRGLGIFKKTVNEMTDGITDVKQTAENEVRQIKHDLDRKV